MCPGLGEADHRGGWRCSSGSGRPHSGWSPWCRRDTLFCRCRRPPHTPSRGDTLKAKSKGCLKQDAYFQATRGRHCRENVATSTREITLVGRKNGGKPVYYIFLCMLLARPRQETLTFLGRHAALAVSAALPGDLLFVGLALGPACTDAAPTVLGFTHCRTTTPCKYLRVYHGSVPII